MALLDGKVAVITGAARGQGRAHALTCAREGADVVLLDVDADTGHDLPQTPPYPLATNAELEDTAAGVRDAGRRALAIPTDVRSAAELRAATDRALDEFGRIDILIANAGIWSQGTFWELSDEQWDDMIGTNLTGVWRSAKAVAPHMIERRRGSMVVTSSVNGIEPGAGRAHYVAAKHGVLGLMKNMALELAPYGIRCNAVCPGAIDTPMTNNQPAFDMFAGHQHGSRPDMERAGRRFSALAGLGFLSPQTIADAALYLNSDLASAVTGVTLPVDAGHLLMPGANPVADAVAGSGKRDDPRTG